MASQGQFASRVLVGTLLPVTAVALFAQQRDRAQLRREVAAADSTRRAQLTAARYAERLLAAGDTLPDVSLRAAAGGTTALRSLPSAGVRYIYFFRERCPACDVLKPFLSRLTQVQADSFAFVAFHPDSATAPSRGRNHYAWVPTAATTGRYVRHVPTLVVVDSAGRVVSVGGESLFHVARVLDLYHMASARAVDSVVYAALGRTPTGARVVSGPAPAAR